VSISVIVLHNTTVINQCLLLLPAQHAITFRSAQILRDK